MTSTSPLAQPSGNWVKLLLCLAAVGFVVREFQVFDQRSDGFDITQDGFLDGGDDVPDMSITIDLVGGEVLVREAA